MKHGGGRQHSRQTPSPLCVAAGGVTKIDPSFKSKRYRDKLRTEIKLLESFLPVEKASSQRKLDSQTVFRLTIAYFRTKLFFKAAGLSSDTQSSLYDGTPDSINDVQTIYSDVTESDQSATSLAGSMSEMISSSSLLQALDGFLLVVTADGTILFISENIAHHLGFQQVDLMMRCIYGIVHPDDHQEMKTILEYNLGPSMASSASSPLSYAQTNSCAADMCDDAATCRSVSFLCRMKCFNGTTTGFLKMHCTGHMRCFPEVTKSQRTANQVLFAFCRPFICVSTDPTADSRNNGFWSKHTLDMRFKQMDTKITDSLGYEITALEGQSFYKYVHPEDLGVFRGCHTTLITTEEIQTMYFRVTTQKGQWMWLHTRGKVVFKNSKKYSIVFTHCPVREEDSTFIQQEAVLRQRFAIHDIMYGKSPDLVSAHSLEGITLATGQNPNKMCLYGGLKDDPSTASLHDPHGECPSSWHTSADRHSPVFPNGNAVVANNSAYQQLDSPAFHRKRDNGHFDSNEPDPSYPSSLPERHGGQGWPGYYNDACAYHSRTSQVPEENVLVPFQYPSYYPQHVIPTKEYHMHFNGVGVKQNRHIEHYGQPRPSSTLFFQGHVTAIESEHAHSMPHPYSCRFAEDNAHGNCFETAAHCPEPADPSGFASSYYESCCYSNNGDNNRYYCQNKQRSESVSSELVSSTQTFVKREFAAMSGAVRDTANPYCSYMDTC